MKLSEYLSKLPRGGFTRLVEESGVSAPTWRKAAKGYAIRLAEAQRIAAACGGKVSARKLVGL